MIHFDKVTKIYRKQRPSLEDISIHVNKGEFVSVVGHSGAGKTTLIRLLLAEEKPSDGSVFLDGTNIHHVPRYRLPRFRRKLGVVFQDFKLLDKRTAFENVSFAMEAAGRFDSEIKNDVPHMLSLVNLLDKAHNFPWELSGGERQRLAIARAIINQPDVIIADEPTGNLDPKAANEVIDILKKINDLGTTVLLTTHNTKLIEEIPHRMITLDSGRIIHDSGYKESDFSN